MNVYSISPWGFLSVVMRNVSGTWQVLAITRANKQKDLSRTEIFCSPVCGLAATSLLEKHFILLFSSAGGVSIWSFNLVFNHIRRECVHSYSMLFRFACFISILVWTMKKSSYHCISHVFVSCFPYFVWYILLPSCVYHDTSLCQKHLENLFGVLFYFSGKSI